MQPGTSSGKKGSSKRLHRFPRKNQCAAVWIFAVVVMFGNLSTASGYMGEGVHIGDAVFDPFVELAATYDSNVNLQGTNEQSDIFTEIQAGLQMHYEPGWYTVDGRGFVIQRRYTKFTDKDFNNGGERISLISGSRESVSVLVMQSYRLIDDYDRSTYYGESISPESQNLSLAYDKSMRVKRTLNDVGVILGRDLTDKSGLDLGVSYSAQNYDVQDLYNVADLMAQAEIFYRVTDKSAALITGQYGIEKNKSFAKDASYLVLRGGVKTKSTDKMTLKAGLGVEEYNRDTTIVDQNNPDEKLYGGARNANQQIISADLTATWIATDKITVEVSGRTGIQSAQQYINTLNHVTVGSANAVYQLSDSTTLALTGAYRQDKYMDPVIENNTQYDRVDNRVAWLLRGDYRPLSQFMTVFGEIGYENAKSTVPDFNYNQLRLSIGVSAHY
jgi:hypothetical protein